MNTQNISLPSYFYIWPAIFYALIVYASAGNGFFWDGILWSKSAQWYFFNGLGTGILPEEINAGHPPLFAWYLAFVWKMFSFSLQVSHWAMYPLLVGIGWQATRLANGLVSRQWVIPTTLLLLADTSLLAQSTQISPELALVLFFLLAVNTILQKKSRLLLAIAFVGLAFIGTRGIILCMALFVGEMLWYVMVRREAIISSFLKNISAYLLAGLLVIAWQSWHYHNMGWVGYNPTSEWSENYKFVDFKGFMRNIVVMGWVLSDLGRIAIWLVLALGLYLQYRSRKTIPDTVKTFLLLIVSILLVSSPFFLLYKNPIGHRYLIYVMLLATSAGMALLTQNMNTTRLKYVYSGGLLLLLSGHCWIYPDNIAKGWDSTLAHIPYFSHRQAALDYLKTSGIRTKSIGTDFPCLAQNQYTDLQANGYIFIPKDLASQAFILQSNIMNGFSDEELHALQTPNSNWQLVQQWGQWPVYIRLYRKQ